MIITLSKTGVDECASMRFVCRGLFVSRAYKVCGRSFDQLVDKKSKGIVMMKYMLIIIFGLLISFLTDAKNCKKSQPCGNSCISWNKVCRIGTSSVYVPTVEKSTLPPQVKSNTLSNHTPTVDESMLPTDVKRSNGIKMKINEMQQETKDITFGCETRSIVNRFIFDDSEKNATDKAVETIRAMFLSRGEIFNDVLEKEIRVTYSNLLGSSLFNEPTIEEIKTNSHRMKNEYIPSCVEQALELLSKRNNSLNR
jgi:hypothetical protein